jgi:hypothetical protein
MKKVILIFALCTAQLSMSSLKPSTREMIIICDCGTESIERITSNFSAHAASGIAMIESLQHALTAQAAPILTTGQLMDFFVACKDKAGPFLAKPVTDDEAYFYQSCHALSLTDFTIKKISDGASVLYLIIPNSYLVKYGKTDQQLGLQISKFPTTTVQAIRANKTPENKDCSSYLVQQLPNIFVTLPKASYTDDTYTSPYTWAIVLHGHGAFSATLNMQLQEALAKKRLLANAIADLDNKISALSSYNARVPFLNEKMTLESKADILNQMAAQIAQVGHIAGMGMSDFKQFLAFLNNRIVTSILVYISCSSGGQNFVDPYKETTSGNIIDLKYAVVTASVTEAIVTTGSKIQIATRTTTSSTGTKTETTVTKIGDIKSYSDFFTALHNPQKPIDQIVALLINIPYKGSGDIENLSLLPSIRTPHSSWITVPTDNTYMLAITKTKALAQGEKPLTINNKQVILVAPQELFFELKIPSTKFPAMISQTPGLAYHYFTKISTQAPLNEVIKGFLPLQMTSSKLFYIQELVCASGTYTDVMIFVNAPLQTAESIIIKENRTAGGVSIGVATQSIPLSTGIFITQNKQATGKTWSSDIRQDPASLTLAPRTDFATVQKAILFYFDMPLTPAPKPLEEGQKLTVAQALEKQKKGIKPKKYLTPPATPTIPAKIVAQDIAKNIMLLAESLQALAG